MYESTRQSSENYIADIYDAPRWRKAVGEPTLGLGRIGLEYCVDGTPIFRRKHLKSIKVAQFSIYSLPPWLRSKAEYMLVQMLVPSKLKGQAAKKYYDFAGREMNKLRRDGVDGVKVEVFGVSCARSTGDAELPSSEFVLSVSTLFVFTATWVEKTDTWRLPEIFTYFLTVESHMF